MRYMLRLAYSGQGFHGWQRQPDDSSVQQTLEEALAVILRHPVDLTGAGRTDAGVHALTMYAHFDTPEPIANPDKFLVGLNRLSGHNVTVQELLNVQDDAHARFDATSRSYKYFISCQQSPFLNDVSWFCPASLNLERMNVAAKLLLTTEDFTSFAKLHSDAKTNICRVTEAEWKPWKNNYDVPGIVFTITADRFLRNMVRAVVGTLVDVGRGKLDIEGFKRVIEAKDRCMAGNSVPPQGLFLWDITYPYIK